MLAITGGTGFVGSRLIDLAREAGYGVRALTRRPQPDRDGVTWIDGALDTPAALMKLAEGADAVIHVAGVTSAPGSSWLPRRQRGRYASNRRCDPRGGCHTVRPRVVLVSARAGPLLLWSVKSRRRRNRTCKLLDLEHGSSGHHLRPRRIARSFSDGRSRLRPLAAGWTGVDRFRRRSWASCCSRLPRRMRRAA